MKGTPQDVFNAMSNPVSAVASGVTTIIKICEISLALKAVKEQTTSLLSTTQHVQRNILEAKRLIHQKSALLTFEEKSWMERQIRDTEDALLEVARLVEAARVSIQSTGSTDMKTKAVWVFRDNLKAGEKMMRLSMCAGTLNTVINALYSKDVVVVQPVEKVEEVDDDIRDTDDDGLPNYLMSQLLLSRKTSRMRLRELDRSPVPSLSAVKEDLFDTTDSDMGKAAQLPTAATTEIRGKAVSPPTMFTPYPTEPITPVGTGKPIDSVATQPRSPEIPRRMSRQRRSWVIHHAERSSMGHSDLESG